MSQSDIPVHSETMPIEPAPEHLDSLHSERVDTEPLIAVPTPKKMKIEHPTTSSSEIDCQEFLEELDSVQNYIDSVDERANADILEVQNRFTTVKKPLFDRRNRLILKIENFWMTTFVNHPLISRIVHGEEEDCLHYLKKIEVEDMENGHRIRFHFSPNPYFDNDVLTKEYYINTPVPCSRSTKINWKEGENIVTIIREREEAKAKRSGRKRGGEIRSFFTWYEENLSPKDDEVAEVIREDLWANPLQYYLSPDIDIQEHGERRKELYLDSSTSSETTSPYEEDEDREYLKIKNKPDLPKAESVKEEIKSPKKECLEHDETASRDSKSDTDPAESSVEVLYEDVERIIM